MATMTLGLHDADVLFKAPADRNRRTLLDRLHEHDGRTLNERCEHLDTSRQAVTQHVGLLEAATLVATVRRGREKLHFLNPVPLQEIDEPWIAKFEKPQLTAIGIKTPIGEGSCLDPRLSTWPISGRRPRSCGRR